MGSMQWREILCRIRNPHTCLYSYGQYPMKGGFIPYGESLHLPLLLWAVYCERRFYTGNGAATLGSFPIGSIQWKKFYTVNGVPTLASAPMGSIQWSEILYCKRSPHTWFCCYGYTALTKDCCILMRSCSLMHSTTVSETNEAINHNQSVQSSKHRLKVIRNSC